MAPCAIGARPSPAKATSVAAPLGVALGLEGRARPLEPAVSAPPLATVALPLFQAAGLRASAGVHAALEEVNHPIDDGVTFTGTPTQARKKLTGPEECKGDMARGGSGVGGLAKPQVPRGS